MTKQNANQITCLWPCWWQSWRQIAKPIAQCRGSFWKVVVPSLNSLALRRHRSDRGYGDACVFHTTARCGSTCRLQVNSGLLLPEPSAASCLRRSTFLAFQRADQRWIWLPGMVRAIFSILPFPYHTQTLSFSGIASLQRGEAQYCRTKEKEKRLAKEMSLWLGSKTLRRTLISFSFWYPSFSSSL